MKDFQSIINSAEYDFLRTNSALGDHLKYLVLGGSYAYGLETEESDLDLRGFFVNDPKDFWALGTPIDFVADTATDTQLFSLKKFLYLLTQNNPNMLELIGVDKEAILLSTPIADCILNNQSVFLTKQVFFTFSGYSIQQLRRLQNALVANNESDELKEQHMLQSMKRMLLIHSNEFNAIDLVNDIELFIDESNGEVFIDFKRSLPLRELLKLYKMINNNFNNFDKINHRNRKKDDYRLHKHACHLIRLLLSAIDILKTGRIRTKMTEFTDLLRSIKAGEVTFDYVFDLQKKLEQQLQTAYDNSKLPNNVDFKRIDLFLQSVMYNLLDR